MTFVISEDTALKTYLAGMTVSDEKNPTRPVKVWFGYPDIELRTQEFPFVVIELIGVRPAYDRMHSGVFTDVDMQGTVAPSIFATAGTTTVYNTYTYEIPVPYDLLYQLTTYSRHPLHDRALILQMHQKFPSRRGFLKVPNQLGTQNAYRHMFLEGFNRREIADVETSGSRRLLTNVYTIRVMSEMTPSVVASATGAVLNAAVNKTPLQYSVPQGKQSI
jgi:hypothetical protein